MSGRTLGALVLSKDETVRVYAVEDTDEEPYRSTVYSINLPVDILKKMYLEKEEDYIAFLNGVISKTNFEFLRIQMVDIYSWGLKKIRKRSCRRSVFRFRV